MYIGSFHSQPQISKIFTGLHTIYTYAQEACTQGICVSTVGFKLTHLATASKLMRKVHWQVLKREKQRQNKKQGEIYTMYNYYRLSEWKWHHVVVYSKESLGRGKSKEKEIWTNSHRQTSRQRQHIEGVTVCITYDTVCTHFHINDMKYVNPHVHDRDWDDHIASSLFLQ